MSRQLPKKPLVEAILEVRWNLQPDTSGMASDPHYRLLLGRLFDRFQSKYPFHEALASATVPDEMVGHIPQHRFRTASDGWPLVQVGPGILTLNDTVGYTWDDFHTRAIEVAHQLIEAYPSKSDFSVRSMSLRYIDAIALDTVSISVLDFLREKLKIAVTLPNVLFAGSGVNETPQHFMATLRFGSNEPRGAITMKLATGQIGGKSALIWETNVESAGNEVPELPAGFEGWIEASHKLANDWFFALIEGDLHQEFSHV